jgi:membrane-associated phospholipid phosphatase
MFDIASIRTWIGISLVWPLFWALVFNRWFFFSPLGLAITFGIPIAGWVLWWKFYEGNGEKLLSEGRLVLGKGIKTFFKVKKQISKKRVSSQQ